jgi:hypothetical protein
MWGILPIGSSVLAIVVLLLFPERKRIAAPVEIPAAADHAVYMREAK